jgi:hypothetical protein
MTLARIALFALLGCLTLGCGSAQAQRLRTVATASALPSTGENGDQILVLDTNATYVCNAGTWTRVAATPAPLSVTDASVSTSAAIARTKLASGTANQVVINNGSGVLSGVSPGTSGNVLTSNGTAWASSAPTGGPLAAATVTSTGSLTHGKQITSTSKGSTGVYTVTLTTACDSSASCDCVATVTGSTTGIATIEHTSTTVKTVTTLSSAGASGDRAFSFFCYSF